MTAPSDASTDRGARTQGTGRPRMRASDADREAVIEKLHDGVLRGLLTVEEGAERMSEAYATRFVDDLPGLTEDLPPRPDPEPVAPGWRSVASTAALQARTSLLGAPTWSKADHARRRAVLVTGILLGLLLVIMLTTAAAAGTGSGGTGTTNAPVEQGYHHYHHWHDWDDDDDN